jgi:hypothetical protein
MFGASRRRNNPSPPQVVIVVPHKRKVSQRGQSASNSLMSAIALV